MVNFYARLLFVLMCGSSMIFPASTAREEGKGEMPAHKSPTDTAGQLRYAHNILTHPGLPEDAAELIKQFACRDGAWKHEKTIEGSFKHCKPSADGTLLFSYNEETSEVSIFDVRENRCLRTFSVRRTRYFNFALSDDLSTIVYATPSRIEVYTLDESGFYKQRSIKAPEDRWFDKETVAVSGDGSLLAYNTYIVDTSNREVPTPSILSVWDTVNHIQKCVIEHGNTRVLSHVPFVIFDNGSSVATGSVDDTQEHVVIKIFTLENGSLLKELRVCPVRLMSGRQYELAVSGDSAAIMCCCYRTCDWSNSLVYDVLRKWNCTTGAPFPTEARPLAVSGNVVPVIPQLSRNASWLVVNSFWNNIHSNIVNVKTGREAQSFPGSQKTALLARDSHDVFMCGRDDIQVWSPAPSEYEALMKLKKEGEDAHALCNTLEDSEGSYERRGLAYGLPLGIRQLIGSYVSLTENFAPNRVTMRPVSMPPLLPGTSSSSSSLSCSSSWSSSSSLDS